MVPHVLTTLTCLNALSVPMLRQVSAEALGHFKFTVFEHLEAPTKASPLGAGLAKGVVFEHLDHPFRMTSEVSGHTKGVVKVLENIVFLLCSRVFYKSLRFPV